MIEADYYQTDMLKQHTATSSLNLIFINSLKSIENENSLVSHTERIYYFIVNYTPENLA